MSVDAIIKDSMGEVAKRISIGPSYSPATRYVHAAFVLGDISYDEAYSILVGKYHFGKEGAKESLNYCKQYPKKIPIPYDYNERLYGNEGL